MVLARQIIELFSAAEAYPHLALCTLDAVKAHIEALPSTVRI